MLVTRLRVGLVTAMAVVLALAAGDIFDRTLWRLLPAALVPGAVAVMLARRGALVRLAGGLASIAASLAFAIAVSGGTFGDAVDALTAGGQRILSTDWPSPDRADLIGAIAAVLAVTAAVAGELAMRRRWHLLPLLPLTATYIGVTALSAPLGVQMRWLLPFGVLAIGFAALRGGAGGDEQLTLLRGERRLIPVAVLATVVAALVSVPVDLGVRADPRRNDPPEQTAPLLDPIEATLALRALDPPIDLHEIRGATDAALPAQWRTAALDTYDGERWTPDLALRPIGRRLGPADGSAIEYVVRFLDDDLSLVPLSGGPVTVDAPIETDDRRTIVRLVDRPSPDDEIRVTANTAPSAGAETSGPIATRPVDETVSGLTEFAENLAGDGTVLDRLRTIEQTMRNDFVLESDAPGGGVQRALIERFLRDTERGNAEQFATSFVLLARSLGVDARVATGYRIEPEARRPTITLRSADATIWPEVRLVDGTWLAFDPVPPEEASDLAEPPTEPQVQTPAAPQPPIVPPPDPTDDTPLADQTDDGATTGALSNAVVWLVRGAAIGGLVLLPVLIAIGVVVGIKRRRRRRRVRNAVPEERIRGLWASATDALVDAGLSIEPSATDAEIARDGEPLAPAATDELHLLATLSSAATYGSPARADDLADAAATCLDEVEAAVGAELTRWQRMRWRLSWRSLRRSTRSPVDA